MAEYFCPCGLKKNLKDQYIGRKSKCPKCGRIGVVRASTISKISKKSDPGAVVSCECGFNKRLGVQHIGRIGKCPRCGERITVNGIVQNQLKNSTSINKVTNEQKASEYPKGIEGWNWGAFFLNFIWGIGNKSYFPLLIFATPLILLLALPLFLLNSSRLGAFQLIFFIFLGANLCVLFICGYKGNKWAWKNKKWSSIEHFKATQKKWSLIGGIGVPSLLVLVFIITQLTFRMNDVYKNSVERVTVNRQVVKILGRPVKPGWIITGSYVKSGFQSSINLNYSISGPKYSGNVSIIAFKYGVNDWNIIQFSVDIPKLKQNIELDMNPPDP